MKTFLRRLFFFTMAAGALLHGTGCATRAMKGTPFYSGEWEHGVGPVEDRIALWPLVYYRNPALSVLWPFFEKTPDDVVLRPFFSVHGLKSGQREYSVFWPLGQFNPSRNNYWVFPFFWGKERFTAFPLVWHRGRPFSGGDGLNSVFPLWIYERDGEERSLDLLWPLAAWEWAPTYAHSRIFPLYFTGHDSFGRSYFRSILYGHVVNSPTRNYGWLLPFYAYHRDGDDRTWMMTPLCWRDVTAATSWHTVFPLWYRYRSPQKDSFYCLLGGGSRSQNGASRFVSPLFLKTRKASGESRAIVPPLLSWKEVRAKRSDWFALCGLGHFSFGEKAGASHLIPFFFRSADKNLLVTPLFQKGRDPVASVRWHSIAPFYLRRTSDTASLLATPLGGWTRRTDGTGRTITPLYFQVEDTPGQTFSGIPPLLSWRNRAPGKIEDWGLLGLARFSHGTTPGPSHVFPLFYYNPVTSAFTSPLFAQWNQGDTRYSLIPPLLSWRSRTPGTINDWWLFGLGRYSHGTAPDSSYLFPLFYRHATAGSFATLLYGQWANDGKPLRILPPLLSWWRTDGRGNRYLFGAGGLYYRRTGSDGILVKSSFFPLYAYSRDAYFYSLLYGRDAPKDGTYTYWMTPLVGTRRHAYSGSWVFPLWNIRKDRATGYHHSSFLLWGAYHTSPTRRETSFFPLFSVDHYRAAPDETALRWRRLTERDSLSLFLVFRDKREVWLTPERPVREMPGLTHTRFTLSRNRCFPLWSFSSRQYGDASGPTVAWGNLFGKLYDLKREDGTPAAPHHYVRHRILWRVWHYEQLDGQVSVDSVPFITYDRKPDGFKKVTFLWRFFRYERNPAAGTKVDLLFLPIWRS